MSGWYRSSAAFMVCAWLSFAGHQVLAQKVYKWTDKEGKVHFSNVGPEGEGADESASAVAGVEARPSEEGSKAAAQTAEASRPPRASPDEESAKYSELSEEEFSARASATRMRLKRELNEAKARREEAAEKLAALKSQYNQPTQMGIEVLQKAYGPSVEHPFSEAENLRKAQEKADKRIEQIRKEYAELHDEAVKRLGHQPAWWLPLD